MVRRIWHESSVLNWGKKGHFARDYSKPPKVPFLTQTPKLYVRSNALVVNSLLNWIVDTGESLESRWLCGLSSLSSGFTNSNAGQ